jgi:signal transduction histidine kinase
VRLRALVILAQVPGLVGLALVTWLALREGGALGSDDESVRFRARLIVLCVGMAATLAGALLGSSTSARVTDRVQALLEGARRISEGDTEHRVVVPGHDELTELGEELDRMSAALHAYKRSARGELVQAQRASQAAIESLLDPVFVVSARGQTQMANRAAKRLNRELPAVHAALEQARRHVVEGRGPYVPADFTAAVMVPGEGGEHALLPRAAPIQDPSSGDLVGVTLVLQDVTRLRHLDELKSDLLHTLGRELRAPLDSLAVALHLAQDPRVVGTVAPKQLDLLATARADVDRLRTLLDDLLDLSRLREGTVELHRGRVDIAALASEVVEDYATDARDRGVTLTAEAPSGAAAALDHDRMRVVLDNIVANAIRYTPSGGRVVVRARPGPPVRFEVDDTGPGIPPGLRDRVFEPFFRAPGGETGGSGLGLSIAKEVVAAHGGRIGVEEAEDGGARVWVEVS